jgi:diguanylate cyclase (GGDEF)-like protein/PAS domain S-box-containing protein
MAGTVEDVSEAVRVREEVQQAANRLRATLDSLLDPHVYLQAAREADGRIVDFVFADANEAACVYNHTTREKMIGARLLDVLPGHRTAGLIHDYASVVDTGIPYIVDGQAYFNEILGKEVRSDVRGIRVGDGLNLSWREVTERYEIAEALATSEERYRLLAENITDVVGHVRQGRFVWVSSSVSGTLGWLMSDLIGQPYSAFVHPEDWERVAAGGVRMETGRTTRGRYRLRAKDGEYHWIDSRGGPFSNSSGIQDGFVVSVRVIDAEVQALETLEVRARLDQLTGLPNRAEAFERLGLMLGQSVRTGALIAVVFCDFDRFKQVNDTFGHAVGDALLRIVADRFRTAVRAGDLVARIGGDELLVVLDGVHDLQDAKDIAEKLRRVVGTRVEVPGGVVNATMSFGITLAAQGETLDEVIARADLAMYEAKHAGRDHVTSIPAN